MGLSSKVNENQFQIINGVLDRLIKEQDLKLEKKDKPISEISQESKSKIEGLLKIRNNLTSKFSKEQQLESLVTPSVSVPSPSYRSCKYTRDPVAAVSSQPS